MHNHLARLVAAVLAEWHREAWRQSAANPDYRRFVDRWVFGLRYPVPRC